MRNALLVISLLTLLGCASSGTKVTEQQTTQFKAGQTSRDQVIASLGAPNSTSLGADGTRIDLYVHVRAAANAASYIPVVGLLAGGAHGETTTATFTYAPDGILKSVASSTGQSEMHTGLLNQQ